MGGARGSGGCLLSRELRNLFEEGGVVALGGEAFEDAGVGFGVEGGFAAEDPGEFAIGVADDGPLVVFIEVDDEVGDAEGPDELDAPFGVGGFVGDPGDAVPGLEGSVEGAFAEEEDVVDFAIGAEGVAVEGADFAFFEGVGDVGVDEPVAHVAGEIDMGDGLERGEVGGFFHGGAGGEDQEGGEKEKMLHGE